VHRAGADPGGSGGQGDNFLKFHFWGKEEFPASRSIPTLMVFHCFFSFSFGSFRVKRKSTGDFLSSNLFRFYP
jgi:hypothetical protein